MAFKKRVEYCPYCHNTLEFNPKCCTGPNPHSNINAGITTDYDEWKERITEKFAGEIQKVVFFDELHKSNLYMVDPVAICEEKLIEAYTRQVTVGWELNHAEINNIIDDPNTVIYNLVLREKLLLLRYAMIKVKK